MGQIINVALTSAGKFIVELALKSLTEQGHVVTSELYNSVGYEVKSSEDLSEMEVSFLLRGIFTDKGRKRGTKRVPIDALVEWVKDKGITTGEKEALQIAWAIQTAIYKEGIPTKGSVSFSSTGERTKWFTSVVEDEHNLAEVERIITEAASKEIDILLTNMVAKY